MRQLRRDYEIPPLIHLTHFYSPPITCQAYSRCSVSGNGKSPPSHLTFLPTCLEQVGHQGSRLLAVPGSPGSHPRLNLLGQGAQKLLQHQELHHLLLGVRLRLQPLTTALPDLAQSLLGPRRRQGLKMPQLFMRNFQDPRVSHGNGFRTTPTKGLRVPQEVQDVGHVRHLYSSVLGRIKIFEKAGCSRTHCCGRAVSEEERIQERQDLQKLQGQTYKWPASLGLDSGVKLIRGKGN